MLEKADYTCNYAVIRQTRQPTHLPVICIIPSFPTRRIIKKKGSGKHFHNVLCLSEAKGMDIKNGNSGIYLRKNMDRPDTGSIFHLSG